VSGGTETATDDHSGTAVRRAPGGTRWTSALGSAVVGAGVVLGVHYGRAWADGTCTAFGDCLGVNASLRRYLLLVAAVVLLSAIALIVARVSRAWLVLPIAFALQGAVMFVVEHADGFWLPMWLDTMIGAATWGVAAALLARR